jgi:hypothetical protein
VVEITSAGFCSVFVCVEGEDRLEDDVVFSIGEIHESPGIAAGEILLKRQILF